MQIFNMIHEALTKSLAHAPTQTRLDVVTNSAETIEWIHERAKLAGTKEGALF